MSDSISRRDWLMAMGAASAGGLLKIPPPLTSSVPILPLSSTSEVFVPPRGRAFMKFSFDFPEPSVEFAGLRFGVLVFTRENTYALDPHAIAAAGMEDAVSIKATRLTWAGGQRTAPGTVDVRLHKDGDAVRCDIAASMEQPVKAVTLVVRGIPRGKLSAGGGEPFDPKDDEVLWGYPFGAGDLWGDNTAWGLGTPLTCVQAGDGSVTSLSSLDDRVRAKRFYFQPGEQGYKVELVHEVEGWMDRKTVQVPTWCVRRAASMDAAVQPHYQHLERAYHFPRWETRTDVPAWLRQIQLVVTLHGMHFTGYMFNDYARMLEILGWIAAQMPADRVLAFISAWDGRYYWDYPTYQAAPRMGGEAGFKRLIQEGQRLGFKMMPMFGANASNRKLPNFANFADAATERVDGDPFNLSWVDWDNDRHQEGFGVYMNLGVASWRRWLTARIADTIDRYGVDAYFLDIIGGWMNNTKADMHEGARTLISELRTRYPKVLCCGEFLYDALLEFIPLYHASYSTHYVPYARFFSHLSHPAPGRGSSGVHESGFSRWDPATLSLTKRDGFIPTLNVVDDTFASYRDQMTAVIARAKAWGNP